MEQRSTIIIWFISHVKTNITESAIVQNRFRSAQEIFVICDRSSTCIEWKKEGFSSCNFLKVFQHCCNIIFFSISFCLVARKEFFRSYVNILGSHVLQLLMNWKSNAFFGGISSWKYLSFLGTCHSPLWS